MLFVFPSWWLINHKHVLMFLLLKLNLETRDSEEVRERLLVTERGNYRGEDEEGGSEGGKHGTEERKNWHLGHMWKYI